MVRRAFCLSFLVMSVGCGRDPETITHSPLPIVTQGNTPAPDAALNAPDAPTLVQAPTNNFQGTVSELHAFQNRKSGLPVSLPFVLVTANAGNGETMYVNDPESADFSGVRIERCEKTDKICKAAPPALGSAITIVGTLFVSKDGSASVGKVTVTPASGAAVAVAPRGVLTTDVVPDKIVGNEAIRAMPVKVVDQDGNPSVFVVEDLEPADDMNANFPPELNAQCGIVNAAKPENAMAKCCPAGIGPKFFSFKVREKSSGLIVAVQTTNYRDITFNSFPCSAQDLAETLKVGDEFTTLGGIFDVNFSKASISPGAPEHYVLVRK